MSTESTLAMTSSPQRPAHGALRLGAIGVAGMVFMVIAATAPLTAMASNISLSLGIGAGVGTLGWLVAVGALLAVFTSGYIVLSRHVVNAGAYYAYIGYGLGRTIGSASAFVAGIAYNMATAAMIAAAGYFTDATMTTYLRVDLPWYVYALVAVVIVWALGYFGVSIASRVTTAICLAQFALLAALVVAVLLQRPDGYSLTGYTPAAMLHGNYALALVFCTLSFSGYEATAIYGEECKAPVSSIRKATYLALGLLLGVFVVATWSIVAAYDDVAAAAETDPGTLIMRAADQYLGAWSGLLISICLCFSFLAAAVAFHNMAARYHFSLGRAGLLPRRLARAHPKYGSPSTATNLQILLCLVILAPFVVAGMDPLINLFPAVSGVTSLAVVYLMSGCCLSVVIASLRGAAIGSMWSTRVAPVLAGLGLLTIGVIIVANYQAVTGSESQYIAFMPAILAVGAGYGAITFSRNKTVALEDHLKE
jgi:amino acid transporter